jgi:hypothetical protein
LDEAGVWADVGAEAGAAADDNGAPSSGSIAFNCIVHARFLAAISDVLPGTARMGSASSRALDQSLARKATMCNAYYPLAARSPPPLFFSIPSTPFGFQKRLTTARFPRPFW